MSNYEYKFFYRRNLPHYQPNQAKFFITFRLADSLPMHVLEELKNIKEQMKKSVEQISDRKQKKELNYENHRRWFGRYDDYLVRSETGPKWLSDPRIAKLVDDSIKYRDGKVYHLDAFCIMPNHVHLVIEPLIATQFGKLRDSEQAQFGELRHSGFPQSLSRILHSLKLYTAKQANLLLEREGRFWLHENYDHVVRDDGEFERIMKYVLFNPVKAKLVDSWEKWEWSYCKYV